MIIYYTCANDVDVDDMMSYDDDDDDDNDGKI